MTLKKSEIKVEKMGFVGFLRDFLGIIKQYFKTIGHVNKGANFSIFNHSVWTHEKYFSLAEAYNL